MGLKKKTVTLTSERDNGKTFQITELPARRANKWAKTLLHHAVVAGVSLREVNINDLDTTTKAGMIEIGFAIGAIIGRIHPDVSETLIFDLLDECVRIIPSGGEPRLCSWNDEIEDWFNFDLLFGHAVGLHIDFLKIGQPSS